MIQVNAMGDTCPIPVVKTKKAISAMKASDTLVTLVDNEIAVRSGAHCAPLMHRALGTEEQGALRFSFSHYNTKEEINLAIRALRELAEE